jgi:hypothetical protein
MLSTPINVSWPASTVTSSKDKYIGAYSIGIIIPGKLGCPNVKRKKSAFSA